VDFPVTVAKGSFLPARFKFFFIAPGVKAKYSYVARIPAAARLAILHCWFAYEDGRSYSHTAEKTIAIPRKGGRDRAVSVEAELQSADVRT
jgi:hypothetical protein